MYELRRSSCLPRAGVFFCAERMRGSHVQRINNAFSRGRTQQLRLRLYEGYHMPLAHLEGLYNVRMLGKSGEET